MDPRSESAIFSELRQIAATPGFAHILAYVCIRDNYIWYSDTLTLDDMAHLYTRERLIRTELQLLIGLMIQAAPDFAAPPPEDAAFILSQAEALLEELHLAMGLAPLEPGEERSIETFQRWSGSADAMREPIFYGGEGAFSFQNLDFAVRKYARDADWLRRVRGATIADMARVVGAIGTFQFAKATAARSAGSIAPGAAHLLDIFRFTSGDIVAATGLPRTRVRAAIKALSLGPREHNGGYHALSEYNALDGQPIIALGKEHYLFFVFNALAEALYEAPFYWMNADLAYRDIAAKHRGDFTEDFAFDRLVAVFGARVYRGVELERTKGQRLGEIDVLVLFGDRAIIVEAKSKRLTLAARRGNEVQLKDDFKGAVQKAYDQTMLCAGWLRDPEVRLKLPGGAYIAREVPPREIYPVCVVSDHYPALAFQTSEFLQRSEPDGVRAPLVIDIFALDAMAELLDRPLRFLSYLELRALHGELIDAAHEMTLLGYHVRHNLWPEEGFDRIMLEDDFAAHVEIALGARRLGHPGDATPRGILTAIAGSKLDMIIEAIEARPSGETIDLGLLLYKTSGRAIVDLADRVDRAALEGARKGHSDFTLGFAGTGLTVHCNARSPQDADAFLRRHVELAKYRGRADRWFGLHLAPGSGAIQAASLLAFPWEFDPGRAVGAAALGQGAAPLLAATGRKPGRNTLCPCGSGRKYKRCHGARA